MVTVFKETLIKSAINVETKDQSKNINNVVQYVQSVKSVSYSYGAQVYWMTLTFYLAPPKWGLCRATSRNSIRVCACVCVCIMCMYVGVVLYTVNDNLEFGTT